jgi:hypothetical protein
VLEGGFQTIKSLGAVGAAGAAEADGSPAVVSWAMSRSGDVSSVAMVLSWGSSLSASGESRGRLERETRLDANKRLADHDGELDKIPPVIGA